MAEGGPRRVVHNASGAQGDRLMLAPAIVAFAVMQRSVVHGGSFLQLLSKRYPEGSALPLEAAPPPRTYPFLNRFHPPGGAAVRSAARSAGGEIWVVTDRGTFRSKGSDFVPLELPRIYAAFQPQVNPDIEIAQVASDAAGHIWAATSYGIYITDGKDWWQSLTRRDGVPYEDVTSLCFAPNGDLWSGTTQGAWRLRSGKFRYFWGKRWLCGNRVSSVWCDKESRAWIKTDGGVACIYEQPMTLAAKAAHYDEITQERHSRHGYISEVRLL
ncbi:MAG TPA: hypothetical protein VGS41_11910, partial [Chthonomonadales bacterium]|nr:hypothetical protein [Chthonomonadales bacterium]